ncbi:MAG: FAD-dependent oxidoreductase [Pseudomonadota bacterium]|nr:FAD-dependent oxidoreductase [Pseudomonadota bacterium]
MVTEAKKKRIIVVGGDAAGMSAASQIKRQRPDWSVTVLEQGRYVSYAACGMPYYVEGLIDDFDQLVEITPQVFREKRGIDLRLGHRATAIDPAAKTVTYQQDGGNKGQLVYDELLIATGARPLVPEGIVPGERVTTINNLPQTKHLQQLVADNKTCRAAVIGGGFIGLEMAEAFAAQGIETSLVHRREHLSRMFEEEISVLIKEKLQHNGVKLYFGAPLENIVEQGDKVRVISSQEELEVDLVLLALGVQPNSELARDAGIELGVRESIVVDDRLQTSREHIYAAGDCAQGMRIVDNSPIFSPLALKANREGMIAGLNMAGIDTLNRGSLGTGITKIFDLGIARTGLSFAEAEKAGLQPVKNMITSRSRARYYPDSDPLRVLVIASRIDGRVLGAQLAGPLDAVKRIDTFAVIIHQGLNLDQVMELDLAYAPPFSPVWDPVLLAARITRKKL